MFMCLILHCSIDQWLLSSAWLAATRQSDRNACSELLLLILTAARADRFAGEAFLFFPSFLNCLLLLPQPYCIDFSNQLIQYWATFSSN